MFQREYSLNGDDRLLLLGEDDPAVEEGRDDVLDDEVHLGLAHLVKVLVEVSPAAEREGGCYSYKVPKDLLSLFLQLLVPHGERRATLRERSFSSLH